MEEWKEYNLGDLVELKNGVAFKSSEFIESGIPVIKIKNVKPNKILLDDLSYVSEHSSQNKKCFDILPSDILITMTGNRKDGGPDSWVGKVALFGKSGRYLLNQRVSAIRVKRKDLVEYQYLAYLLSCWDAQLYFVNHSNSSGGQANISPDVVYGYNVTLPSLSEQTRIAAILSSLDDKIEVNRRINDNLEQQAQALFKSWFVDFEPFRDQPFVESEVGMIPEGWRVGTIGDYCKVFTGKKDVKQSLSKGLYPFFSCSPNHTYSNEYIYDGASIIIAGNGSYTGRTSFYFGKYDLYQRTYACTIKEGINEKRISFLYYMMKCLFEPVKMGGTRGSSIPYIVMNDIVLQKFVLEDSLVGKYSDFAYSIMKQIQKNNQESRRLAELRDTLLPRLMSGEIKVGDVTL